MTADYPFVCDECGARRAELDANDGWVKNTLGEGRGAVIEYLCPECQNDG
jgi:uncharacterized protein YlaI